MENSIHRLLARQLKKYFGETQPEISGFSGFVDAINAAYASFEDDHNQLERTLEISSQELFRANQALNVSKKDLEQIVKDRTSELLETNEQLISEVQERRDAELKLTKYAQDLERKNNELDKFAYVVSHDLKAPLRAISNLADWIEEDIGDKMEEESSSHFRLLKGRVSRMEALINGILEYSRAGRMRNDTQELDMYSFVKELVSTLAPPTGFKVNISKNLPKIQGEKLAMEQVFSNYVSNAFKYNNSPNPTIDVSYSQDEDFHIFCVADNGPGIEPEYHQKVFVIFQTLQARDKVEATGVGLAIVKKIVEEKGGRVWIDSAKDKGAKFFFSLPKAKVESPFAKLETNSQMEEVQISEEN